MNILAEIVETKRQRLAEAKAMAPLESVIAEARARRRDSRSRAMSHALRRDGINVIAEFKRRSPSKGVIRVDATPTSMALAYASGGAAGISVLTEHDYFDGSPDDLREVKKAIPALPVLRKDFVFDEYQVYEAAAMGADAVLLIVALLDDETLRQLRILAEDVLEIDALVEVHTDGELKRASACGATFIGVNNRDLQTFAVSLETSLKLVGHAPADALLISESGLHNADDLERLHEAGYQGFLIGESLMRAEKPDHALRCLTGRAAK